MDSKVSISSYSDPPVVYKVETKIKHPLVDEYNLLAETCNVKLARMAAIRGELEKVLAGLAREIIPVYAIIPKVVPRPKEQSQWVTDKWPEGVTEGVKFTAFLLNQREFDEMRQLAGQYATPKADDTFESSLFFRKGGLLGHLFGGWGILKEWVECSDAQWEDLKRGVLASELQHEGVKRRLVLYTDPSVRASDIVNPKIRRRFKEAAGIELSAEDKEVKDY